MRNPDDYPDSRGGRDRRRWHRPGCHARTGHRPGPGPCRRRTPLTRDRSASAGDSPSFPCRLTSVPAAPNWPLATVPGPAGLVSTLLHAAQQHFAEARYAAANAFLKLVPQPNTPPAATWQQLGHLHFSLAEYAAAGRAYGYAAAYHPEDAGLQVRLAHTCLRLEDIDSFESYLQRALALDPESAPALQLLADLNRDHGRYPDAARLYAELLAAKPDHYENSLSLSLCCSHLGAHAAARDWLQRAGQIARGALSPAAG